MSSLFSEYTRLKFYESGILDASYTVHFPRSETSEPTITMLEFEVEQLENDAGDIQGPVWPTTLPSVHGIFVAYDASDLHSFRHVRKLIGKIPIVLIVRYLKPSMQVATMTFASQPLSSLVNLT